MTNLRDLTSRDAVIQAIEECDLLGRDVFLKKYGFRHSRVFALPYNNRVYDSKAIVGVAYGYQHGTPLLPSDFSGGADTVVPLLKNLGFDFGSTLLHPAKQLVLGKTYFRKKLVEQFGGQLQSGIWTPKEFPVVFIFSGSSGEAYGYADGWTKEGVFEYSGEGQTSDMTFTAGNKAIRDHRMNGKDLLLFEDHGKGKGVRYTGLFECISWQEIQRADKDKNLRKAIVFDLVPVGTTATEEVDDSGIAAVDYSKKSLEELRAAALAAAIAPQVRPKTGDAKKTWYRRSKEVQVYVLRRANGICEACDQPAPFMKKDGSPYLEPHHTTRLADQGPDHPSLVGAICPNCHRRIHSGVDGAAWNERLKSRLGDRN